MDGFPSTAPLGDIALIVTTSLAAKPFSVGKVILSVAYVKRLPDQGVVDARFPFTATSIDREVNGFNPEDIANREKKIPFFGICLGMQSASLRNLRELRY